MNKDSNNAGASPPPEMCKDSGTRVLPMTVQTPAGEYTVAACGDGIHSVERTKVKTFSPDISVVVMDSNSVLANYNKVYKNDQGSVKMLRKMVDWFHVYFHEPSNLEMKYPTAVEICIPSATNFQKTVWKSLKDEVGFGKTISYGELANRVGHPRAARAVGSAMKNNPNCILVPCHRVVKSNSDLGNYNGGVDIKRWLLTHENALASGELKQSAATQALPKP